MATPPPCSGTNPPYMSGFANNKGISPQYFPLINTSEPIYYGVLGASFFGCPSNCYPPAGGINAPNLVDRFEAAGLSWRGYMENQNVAAGCGGTTHESDRNEKKGVVGFQGIFTNTVPFTKEGACNPMGRGAGA